MLSCGLFTFDPIILFFTELNHASVSMQGISFCSEQLNYVAASYLSSDQN